MVTPSLHRRRTWLRSFILGLAAALSLGFAGAANAQTGQEAGMQTHLMWGGVDGSEVDRQLDMAKGAGATIVRVDVGWASIEPDRKGQYSEWYLRRLDAVVDKAHARGIKLLLTFWETPCWASTAPETLKQGCAGSWWNRDVQRYGPANPSDFADALAYVARRYKGRIAAWEIWNEPNDTAYFKASDPVGSYADLVKAGYPAAKAADPQATILAGSLAHADYGWTDKLLARGVGGHFDGWSIHPYSGPRSPLDRGDDAWIQASFLRGVPATRDVLLRHGQDKPLWLTEFGWSTCTVRSGGEEWARCIDPDTQATFVRQALDQMRSWSYVKAGFYFKLQDTSGNSGDRNTNYGLLRYDGTPKPAYAAFAAASREMGNPAPGAPVDGRTTGTSGPAGSGTGTRSGSGGAIETETKGRITLAASRKGKRVKLRGGAPRGRVVKIAAYRWLAKRKRYSVRPSQRVKVRVNRKGRYARTLKKTPLRKGRWRVTARLTGVGNARFARYDIGVRRKKR